MFENMWIKVNNEQEFDAVVETLRKSSYVPYNPTRGWRNCQAEYIHTWDEGDYTIAAARDLYCGGEHYSVQEFLTKHKQHETTVNTPPADEAASLSIHQMFITTDGSQFREKGDAVAHQKQLIEEARQAEVLSNIRKDLQSLASAVMCGADEHGVDCVVRFTLIHAKDIADIVEKHTAKK